MKQAVKLIVTCLIASFAASYATMSGQYSVNIHFVPPLVTGSCSVAQFWNPPNVPCALCFCMTGTLSRCIPQPGCVPSNTTDNSTTTEISAPQPVDGASSTPATAGGQNQPTQQTQTVVPTSQPPAPTVPSTQAPAMMMDTTMPSAAQNMIRRRRGAKFAFVEDDDNE